MLADMPAGEACKQVAVDEKRAFWRRRTWLAKHTPSTK